MQQPVSLRSNGSTSTTEVDPLIAELIACDQPRRRHDPFRRPSRSSPPWRMLTVDEVLTMPPVQYLAGGEIRKGGLVVLYGPAGIGKSFVALDYALKLACEHVVVYIAGEGQAGYRTRVGAWLQHHDCKPEVIRGKFHMIDDIVPLLDDEAVTALVEKIKPLQPVLVVIDTLALAMLGGNENDTRDMGALIHACSDIRRLTGAALLLVHHSRKDGKEERGSSALRGAVDVMIELRGSGNVLTLRCVKTKDAEPFLPRYLQRRVVKLGSEGSSCVVAPISKREATSMAQYSRHELAILKALAEADAESEAGLSKAQLRQRAGVPEGSIYRVLKQLSEWGHIQQPGGRRMPYLITESGKATLARPEVPSELSRQLS